MNFDEWYSIDVCDNWYLTEKNFPTDGTWRDRRVWHTTSSGQRNRVLVKSLPAKDQWRYAPIDVKLKLKHQGKDVSVGKPTLTEPTDEQKRLFTVYYAGDRPESYDKFTKGKLVVGTDDSARAIEIEKKGHPVAVAKKVPLDAFKKFWSEEDKDWKEFPKDVDEEQKFELIKFTDGDLYLMDFNEFQDQILFKLSDSKDEEEKENEVQ